MKSICITFICTALFLTTYAQQHDGIYVDGRTVYDACNEPVVIKGVNYSVLDDWNFPATSEKSSEIAKSGANTVRIMWYIDYGQSSRPAYSLSDLDTVISRVARLEMIPIIELHDFTCQPDLTALSTEIVPWLTQASVLDLIDKHKKYLIVNIANEFGHVRYTGNIPAAETAFENAYGAAVLSLRNAGIHVPLMIDGPDCGTTLSTLVNIGSDLLAADPDHNLIFSTHTYWFGYTGNDSTAMRTELLAAANSNLPIILGEVATQQDDASLCQYNLNWRPILRMAEEMQIGWLIWGWYKDGCPGREMTPTGNFADLTAFGQEIVNSPEFGLLNVAEPSEYLLTGGACVMGTEEQDEMSMKITFTQDEVVIQPLFQGSLHVMVTDISGRKISGREFAATAENIYRLSASGWSPGVYVVSVISGNRSYSQRIVKAQP